MTCSIIIVGANKMSIINHLVLCFALMMAICVAEDGPAPLDNVSSVERAIKSGGLGADFEERARRAGNLYLREMTNTGIPYKVFTFSDHRAGYTVMVENNHLVLLCAGFGGGYARDFVIKRENGREVLFYRFDAGSGTSHGLSGHYVLGPGRATWDTQDKTKPQLIN